MSLTVEASRRSRRVFSWIVIQSVDNFFYKVLTSQASLEQKN